MLHFFFGESCALYISLAQRFRLVHSVFSCPALAVFSLHLKKAVQKDSCSQVPRAHDYFASPVKYFLCLVKIFRGTTFRVSKFDFPNAKFLPSRVNDAACCAIRTNSQIPSAS